MPGITPNPLRYQCNGPVAQSVKVNGPGGYVAATNLPGPWVQPVVDNPLGQGMAATNPKEALQKAIVENELKHLKKKEAAEKVEYKPIEAPVKGSKRLKN